MFCSTMITVRARSAITRCMTSKSRSIHTGASPADGSSSRMSRGGPHEGAGEGEGLLLAAAQGEGP